MNKIDSQSSKSPVDTDMSHEDLENTYAALALKIDEVGEAQSELFLAKLVLLLAHKNGDADEVQALINDAAASLANIALA